MSADAREQSLIFLYHNVLHHEHELQLSLHAAQLTELQAYCRLKNAFRRCGALQGRLVLRVPQRSVDECRRIWKLHPYSIHGDHRSLKVHNLSFFHELSVELLGEHEPARLEAEEGLCRLLLPPTAFEDFFSFLCRFAEGHWAYRFEVNERLSVSTDFFVSSS